MNVLLVVAWTVLPTAGPVVVSPARHVIILGGGSDVAAGDSALAAVHARLKTWSPLLADGTVKPVRVASAEVPGLKPGFHVVLAGTCTEEALPAALEVMKALEPGAYARKLAEPVPPAVAALGCPRLHPDHVLGGVLAARVGKRQVRVVRLDEGGNRPAPWKDWRLVVALVDEKGNVVDERVETREDLAGEFGMDCTVAMAVEKKGVTVRMTGCSLPRGCPAPATVDGMVHFGAGENQVTQDARVTRRHEPPCAGE